MNEKTVIDFLSIQNRWWYKKSEFPFNKIHTFKRRDYYYLRKSVDSEEATLIIGPRGVGKSTVLFEIMRNLLGLPEVPPSNPKTFTFKEEGLDGKRIIYLIFDEPMLKKWSILELLSSYCKFVLGEDISALQTKIYVFLDEIQNVESWGEQITGIQNLKYPIKFFISGSSSSGMLDEAAKAARRIQLYTMMPMKFSDVLRLRFRDDSKLVCILNNINSFRSKILDAYRENDSKEVYELFVKLYSDLKFWQFEIEKCFQEYMIKGGYPALLNEPDLVKVSAILKDTFWLGFREDAINAKGVGDPDGLFNLTSYIASISSTTANLSSLQKNSLPGANSDTIKRYLYHLKSSQLATQSMLFLRSNKTSDIFKIYLSDVALRNLLIGRLNKLLLDDQKEYGKTLETLIYDHLYRLQFKVLPNASLTYWRDNRSHKEVDIVLRINGKLMPVEVKKEDEPGIIDVPALKAFCRNNHVGTVVCGKKLAHQDGIVFLPAWLFTIIC